MSRLKILFIGLIGFFSLGFTQAEAQNHVPLIPAPQSVSISKGTFTLDDAVQIEGQDDKLNYLKNYLKDQLLQHFNIRVGNTKDGHKSIFLRLDHTTNGKESYNLTINADKIIIAGGSPGGVFYGIQSLLELCFALKQGGNSLVIQNYTITDAPRFKWRGFMVDESRHFFGKEKIKQYLDLMALFKLNTFHWHLTDEPGWRIQIDSYPKLTTVGAKGNYSNPDAPAQYYSKKDIREIVAYASDRFITIIPEIDMPGHASAANLAYPEFSGGGSKDHPDFTYNPGASSTYQYLTNILREVNSLFPSDYIHIGGDEVHFGNEKWKNNPDVKQLMQVHDLENIQEVESYFIRRMADSVHALGANVAGWDEIARSGVNIAGTIVMWWRHDKPETLSNDLEKGYMTVLCPRIPMYFDFDQYKSHQWGRKWDGNFSDLESVYEFPNGLDIDVKKQSNILGIQANLWTEAIATDKRFDFMVWPRLAAMAEAAWTQPERKSYSSFKRRLAYVFNILDDYAVYYFIPSDPMKNKEPKGVSKSLWQANH